MDVDINNNTSVSDCDIDEIKVEINEIDESNDKKMTQSCVMNAQPLSVIMTSW